MGYERYKLRRFIGQLSFVTTCPPVFIRLRNHIYAQATEISWPHLYKCLGLNVLQHLLQQQRLSTLQLPISRLNLPPIAATTTAATTSHYHI